MGYRTKILKGGIDNEINFSKLEEFVKNHLRYKIGIPLTGMEAEKEAVNLYVWVQEKKRRNAPIITENDVWEYALQCAEISESL